jgi:hypothetical protein
MVPVRGRASCWGRVAAAHLAFLCVCVFCINYLSKEHLLDSLLFSFSVDVLLGGMLF